MFKQKIFSLVCISILLLAGCSQGGGTQENTHTPGKVTESSLTYENINESSAHDVVTAYFSNWFVHDTENTLVKMNELLTGDKEGKVKNLSEVKDPLQYFNNLAEKNPHIINDLEKLDKNNEYYYQDNLTQGEKIILHVLSGSFNSQFSLLGVKEITVDEKKFTNIDDTHITVPLSSVTITDAQGKKQTVDDGVFTVNLMKKDGVWKIDGKSLVDRVVSSVDNETPEQ